MLFVNIFTISKKVKMCGSTHRATFQLAVTHHSNTPSLFPILLSLQTPVSAHNSEPSAVSHHSTLVSIFVLIAMPTKFANRPMEGQMNSEKTI